MFSAGENLETRIPRIDITQFIRKYLFEKKKFSHIFHETFQRDAKLISICAFDLCETVLTFYG